MGTAAWMGEVEVPRFDLLVIEVTVEPPPLPKEDPPAAGPGSALPSLAGSLGFGSSSKPKAAAKPRAVDLHAVIGFASTSAPRPPPHVDCGLLDWALFQRLGEAQQERESSGDPKDQPVWTRAQFQWTFQAPLGVTPQWCPPDPASGVVTSSNLRTASARPIVVALVGGLPSHEFLVSTVPKKQQRWMNWI